MSLEGERRNCDPSKIKAESCQSLLSSPKIETAVFAIIHPHATIFLNQCVESSDELAMWLQIKVGQSGTAFPKLYLVTYIAT